jgi:hypothetical protein
MKGGEELLALLDADPSCPWLVVHGHKHVPRLSFGPGESCPPIIFSAGSVSSTFYGSLASRVRNQFYILELSQRLTPTTNLVGTFRAWDWAAGIGWAPASPKNSLPPFGGFGFRGNNAHLTTRIQSEVPRNGYIKWSELLAKVPELEFTLPATLSVVLEELERRFRVGLLRDDEGRPFQLSRRSR